MQGIQYAHYKLLEEYINKLEEENSKNSYCPYYDNILQHKERLKEIYTNYKKTFEQISVLIKQFEEHKQSIKRLVILQKKKKKEMVKNNAKSITIFNENKERIAV